jgi:hypothetical protein
MRELFKAVLEKIEPPDRKSSMHRGLFINVRRAYGSLLRDHCWVELNSDALRSFRGFEGRGCSFTAEVYIYGGPLERKIGLRGIKPPPTFSSNRHWRKRPNYDRMAQEMPPESFSWLENQINP